MSRHVIPFDDGKIEVVCGFDRPLSTYFLVVDDTTSLDDDRGYLFSNLRDRDDGAMTFEDMRDTASSLGYPIPDDVLGKIRDDGTSHRTVVIKMAVEDHLSKTYRAYRVGCADHDCYEYLDADGNWLPWCRKTDMDMLEALANAGVRV